MKQEIEDISVAYYIIELLLNKDEMIHNQKYQTRFMYFKDVLKKYPNIPYEPAGMTRRLRKRIFFIFELVWLFETFGLELDIWIIDKRHPMVTNFVNHYRKDVFTRVNLCRLINGWTYGDIRNISNNSRLDIGNFLYMNPEQELRSGSIKEYDYNSRYNRIPALAFDDFINSYFGGYFDTAYFISVTDPTHYSLSSHDKEEQKKELLFKIFDRVSKNESQIQQARQDFDKKIHRTKYFKKISNSLDV